MGGPHSEGSWARMAVPSESIGGGTWGQGGPGWGGGQASLTAGLGWGADGGWWPVKSGPLGLGHGEARPRSSVGLHEGVPGIEESPKHTSSEGTLFGNRVFRMQPREVLRRRHCGCSGGSKPHDCPRGDRGDEAT